jgi:DNA repair photolyase
MELKPIKIKNIRRYSEKTEVYDLSVEGNPNFFAGGILVHNCGYGCRYCFADAFRASLYTSFFDNSKTLGIRSCNPAYSRAELGKLFRARGRRPEGGDIQRAVSMEMPLRLGIRFEDFLPVERKRGVSLDLLNFLAGEAYPVMINSKSDLLAEEKYIRALSDNPAGAAVHITLISSNDVFLKAMEPGAPSYQKRIATMAALQSAGIRVVARIEPYMIFLNDDLEETRQYIKDVWAAGVRHITFDTYSYSANNQGIAEDFYRKGWDFRRMFALTSDCQPLGSALLGRFMDIFREAGFSCSTFDLGNVPANDNWVCCEVDGHFKGAGYNRGSIVFAARFIASRKIPTHWADYVRWVEEGGGWLSESLRADVHLLWNLAGSNTAYSLQWVAGLVPIGQDEGGVIWKYDPNHDFREELIKCLN